MFARKSLQLALVVVTSGLSLMAVEVQANPAGVPAPQPVPTSCTTTNFTIAASLGPNNEFPQVVPCNSATNAGKQCAKYAYTISSSSKNVARTIVAISADQDLDSTIPTAPPTGVLPPGTGDPATKFLANAAHEYAVAFTANPSKSSRIEVTVVGPSVARLSTVAVKGAGNKPNSYNNKNEKDEPDNDGQKIESCLIAGPGVPGDPFQPMSVTKTEVVAGGKCVARLIYDANGKLTDVRTDPP